MAYVGIAAASITRTVPVTAALPAGATPSTGNGQAGENDAIAADVEGLTGGNGNDTLTGNAGAEHDRRLRASRHAQRRSPARGHGEPGHDQRRGTATTRCSPATAAR